MVADVPVQSSVHPPDASREHDPGPSTGGEPGAYEYVQSTVHTEPERFTIAQAATLLGTSRDAIRQRIRRGTLRSEKADGKWYVYLAEEPAAERPSRTDGLHIEPSDHPPTVQSTHPNEDLYRQLVDQLRGEVSFLREELRRKDQLLAGFAQRLPALDAPQHTAPSPSEPDAPAEHQVSQPEHPPAPAATPERRPWWKFWA
jgi:hypothetical protein